MGKKIIASCVLGDMTFQYVEQDVKNERGLRLILFPTSRASDVVEHREVITDRPELSSYIKRVGEHPAEYSRDSLLQIKLAEEPVQEQFSGGVTLFDSPSTASLEFHSQEVRKSGEWTDIQTVLMHPRGLRCTHHVVYRENSSGVEMFSEVTNESDEPVLLELLSSFVLNGLTPFDESETAGRMKIHRFRSWWSAEGRLESRTVEDLHLERPWATCGARSERFGQVGSMPVRHFFPFVAAEDAVEGVVWAAKLAWAGSWQVEILRCGDTLALTGGLVAAPVIKEGASELFGPDIKSWREPEGWQAVLRTGTEGTRALAVIHSFKEPLPETIQVPLQGSGWRVSRLFPEDGAAFVDGDELCVKPDGPFCGLACLLEKE